MTSPQMFNMRQSCDGICRILKALSHPNRLLVLGFLLEGPKTVSELVELCETSQSQMSQFLARMSAEGLIYVKPRGKFRVYAIADMRLKRLIRSIQRGYCNANS